MSDFSGLQLALSSLLAQRQASETIGQNVANANTEGYSRQRVDLVSRGSNIIPGIFSRWDKGGGGVDIVGITRIRDDFMEQRNLGEQASSSALSQGQTILGRVEMSFPEPSDTGLGGQLSDFWAAWDDVANNPENQASRTQLLERANTVAQGFNQAATELTNLRSSAIDQTKAIVDQVNAYAGQIAQLNGSIQSAVAGGLTPNDLMDQRDLLINKVTKLVGVTTKDGGMGKVDVFLGGTALVRGDKFDTLGVDIAVPAAAGSPLANVGWQGIGLRWTKDNYPADVQSGQVAGLIQGANDVVPRYLDQLNGVAATLSSQVNAIHATGYGLNDPIPGAVPGRQFFTLVAGPPYTNGAMTLGLDPAVAGQPANVSVSDGTGRLDVSLAQQLAALHDSPNGADAAYKALIGNLGVESQTAQRRSQIQDAVTLQVDTARKAVSGVNIDEEMINLVQTQHAYDAASRLMTTIDGMLDTLIRSTGLVGR